jgi:hypothetical protein
MKGKPKAKVKEKNANDNFDFMKTNKDNLKNILRDETFLDKLSDILNVPNKIIKANDSLEILNKLAINTNKFVIHAYQFLKLYILHLYDNKKNIPKIDKEYIMDIFKVLTIRKCGSGGYTDENMPDQMKELTKFYNEYYKDLREKDDVLYYDKMSYILAYEAIDIVKNIENNIQETFIDHLSKFINVSFDIKEQMGKINREEKNKEIKKQKKNVLYKEIQKVKNDLLIITTNELTSDKKYHKWILEQRENILPKKNKFDENNGFYDLKSNTMDYLKPMIYLGIELEKAYNTNKEKNKDNKKYKNPIRLFNVLPLRTNIVPKNICLDTCGLIQNFLGNEPTSQHLNNYKKDNNQYNLWNRFFKLNQRVFKKNKYEFHYMIRTDGISVCVLFIRLDSNGKPMSKAKKQNKEDESIKYIEKVEWTDGLKNKKIVCADPNYADLIYCGSKNEDGNLETFRYTQNQRRLETRTKKYSKIMDKDSKNTMIDNKTVKAIETQLCSHNSKTNNFDRFKEYVLAKNKTNAKLFTHYEKNIYRKFKLNRFINTQKSERKMIKNFEKKFGKPKDAIFVMGDYDKGENMRGKEPVICKKFRRIFRNAGFETYLINEYRTSIRCNKCHNELETFIERPRRNPKHKDDKTVYPVHGLLRCSTDVLLCQLIHNRDKNAVQNMLYIIEELKRTGKRPLLYSRQQT